MGLTIVINGKVATDKVQNVLNFTGGAATLANAQAIVDELRDVWATYMATEQSNQYSWETATVYESDQAPGTPGLTITPTAGVITGGRAADLLPNGVACLVSHRTTAGPPWRGRTYIGGMTVDTLTATGFFQNAVRNNLQAGFEELHSLAVPGVGTINLAVKSRGTNQVPANTLAAVTASSGVSNPASQRRRRVGVGS